MGSKQAFGWLFAVALLAPQLAHAQEPPGTESQHTEDFADREADDDVRLMVTAGSALTYGNARNVAVNLGVDFHLRMGQHAFQATGAWLYSVASVRDTTSSEFGDWLESANNLNWKLRYDFFLTPDDALFLVFRGRRDPFASLRPRVGGQAGYLRNFVNEENHRLWGEVGYDFTYDRFGNAPLVVATEDGMPVTSTDRSLHSLRLFIGYDNHINEVLTYQTGFEALMRFDRPEHWRFEWANQFRSKVADWLQISLDVTGRFDALPPGQEQAWDEQPGQRNQMFDLIVTLNLVGTFDLYTQEEEEAEEEPACPPCDCPAPVCPPAAAAVEGEEEVTPEPPAEPAPVDAADTTEAAPPQP